MRFKMEVLRTIVTSLLAVAAIVICIFDKGCDNNLGIYLGLAVLIMQGDALVERGCLKLGFRSSANV